MVPNINSQDIEQVNEIINDGSVNFPTISFIVKKMNYSIKEAIDMATRKDIVIGDGEL